MKSTALISLLLASVGTVHGQSTLVNSKNWVNIDLVRNTCERVLAIPGIDRGAFSEKLIALQFPWEQIIVKQPDIINECEWLLESSKSKVVMKLSYNTQWKFWERMNSTPLTSVNSINPPARIGNSSTISLNPTSANTLSNPNNKCLSGDIICILNSWSSLNWYNWSAPGGQTRTLPRGHYDWSERWEDITTTNSPCVKDWGRRLEWAIVIGGRIVACNK
jgi:hypothetical protein